MSRYKQREFDVDAEQFFPKVGGEKPKDIICYGSFGAKDTTYSLVIKLNWISSPLAADTQAIDPGDWIVRSNRGAVYCMSDEDFHRTYYPLLNCPRVV